VGETVIEPSPRWVRAFFDGVPIADSKRVLMAFEPRHFADYWFPLSDVRADLLERTATDTGPAPSRLGRSLSPGPPLDRYTLRVGGRVAENAAWSYAAPDAAHAALQGHIAFAWKAMDAWYEEDQEVFVHARDPYHRVDAVPSSRHVRVEVEGRMVADTMRPVLLFETGLPTRYYVPKLDVRMDLLEPTDTHSRCPYKGVASYWSLRLGDRVFADLAWSYPLPIPECPKIENLVAFYNEKVDLYVDGDLQERPRTPWS
jgi:uncharacterized protein (DUF427 family)